MDWDGLLGRIFLRNHPYLQFSLLQEDQKGQPYHTSGKYINNHTENTDRNIDEVSSEIEEHAISQRRRYYP